MIKEILNYFRPPPKVVYQYIEPRYIPLGNLDGNLYFMDGRSDKMYRIKHDYTSGQEQVCHVMTMMRF